MMSFGEWAAKLEWAAVRAKNEIEVPTEAIMVAAEKEAKAAIGTYTFGWKQLAASTQAQRAALGYPPNQPLLREGDLQASIEHETTIEPFGAAGVLGSHSIIALWQEMGTSRGGPPRSFLGESLLRSVPLVEITFGSFAMNVLTFGGSS
jgi:hypothetical protein